MQPQSIQSIDAQGRGLILTVTSSGDRFGHSIEMVSGWKTTREKRIVVLSSIEGNDDQDWPTSPPWQDFSIEERGAEHVLLAVGMAGKSHWSASVSTHSTRQAFEFDIACQVSPGEFPASVSADSPGDSVGPRGLPPIFIGSTYQIENSLAGSFEQDQKEVMLSGGAPIRLSTTKSVLQFSPAVSRIAIAISPVPTSELPTLRWNYAIQLAED